MLQKDVFFANVDLDRHKKIEGNSRVIQRLSWYIFFWFIINQFYFIWTRIVLHPSWLVVCFSNLWEKNNDNSWQMCHTFWKLDVGIYDSSFFWLGGRVGLATILRIVGVELIRFVIVGSRSSAILWVIRIFLICSIVVIRHLKHNFNRFYLKIKIRSHVFFIFLFSERKCVINTTQNFQK